MEAAVQKFLDMKKYFTFCFKITCWGLHCFSALEDFILEDMQNRADLLFSWLFSEYSVNHDFSLINKILNIGGKKVQKKDKNYQEILGNIVSKVLLKPASKERDEYVNIFFLP